MIYENTCLVNFIALETAEATGDNKDILARHYENDVEINYTIDKENKIIHILYMEAKPMRQGKGSVVLKEFIKEFYDYSIELEAVFFLREWYERFGFKFQYGIDEMLCYKMKLEGEIS